MSQEALDERKELLGLIKGQERYTNYQHFLISFDQYWRLYRILSRIKKKASNKSMEKIVKINLYKITITLFYIGFILNFLVLFDAIEHGIFYADVRDNLIEQQAADAYEDASGTISFLNLSWYFFAVVVFFIWMREANIGVRKMGAKNLAYTPGWCVGAWFIPFACLWWPYQAVREIWKTSVNPSNWQNLKTPVILPLWWACFLTSNTLFNGSFRIWLNEIDIDIYISQYDADMLDTLIMTNFLDIAACLIQIPEFIFLIAIIYQVSINHQKLKEKPILTKFSNYLTKDSHRN